MAEKKIIDVAGPSDAKVDIGSKPMIVGHKSMATDPMMREKLDTKPEKPEESSGTPSGDARAPEQAEVSTKSETIEPPSVKQKTIEPLANEDRKQEKTADAPEPENIEKADTAKTEGLDKSEKAKEELDETAQELEKEENLRKIIESKKYHVNIKQAHGDSKSWIYVLIGLIISAVIALFILVDTGKLDIGVKLPFSIFGEDQSQSNTTAPVESQPEEVAPVEVEYEIKGDYSLQIPESWVYAREKITDKEQRITYFKDTYTLPSGVKLILAQDIGGKGGVCEPGAGDEPHATDNNCPTEEYLKKTEIVLNDEEKQPLFTDYKLYLVNKKYTSISGVSQYDLCLLSNSESYNPNLGDTFMGFTLPGCGPGVSFANGPSLVVNIEGVDNTTEEFFENDDVLAIEEVLSTFRPTK